MKNNIQQDQAIKSLDGPVLIIAGPGTGKTHTLIERVVYMIGEKNIKPSEIMITTFTNKASLEILDRLSIKFNEMNLSRDINEMLLGNFHGVCRKILDEFIEYTDLSKGYINIDDIEQKYIINKYIRHFRKIPGYERFINEKYETRQIQTIVNKICEYGILDRKSEKHQYSFIFNVVNLYENILRKLNMIDFSHILFYTYKLLMENPKVLDTLRKRINYIMIDEYQDTNSVQEKIIFTLLNENNNICVVGDDDQSLYRFRGATVKNILDFDKKFDDVKVIKLMQNYRSDDSIIKFYSNYLKQNVDEKEELKKFRHSKILYSDNVSGDNRVVKIVERTQDEWKSKILLTIDNLTKNKLVNSLNEIAIIVSSVNDVRINSLISFLKENGLSVYIPKTSTLLSRYEIEKLIGALYAIFKKEIDKFVNYRDNNTQLFLDRCYNNFYKSQLKEKDLNEFVLRMSGYVSSDNLRLSLYDIIYRLFAYNPFFEYMSNEDKAKRLSRFLELVKSFSLINQIYIIDIKNIKEFVNLFFYDFIKLLKDQNVSEFDEDTEIPQEDMISVMTIHSSKGMEYPVVIMASLWDDIYSVYNNKFNNYIDDFISEFSKNINQEPGEYSNMLDFYRKNYTGFSRAKDLLILAGLDSDLNGISTEYKQILRDIEYIDFNKINIKCRDKKHNKIKKKYAFTTDVLPYIKNPLEYYYTRVLKFTIPKTKSLFYGDLVHESIEYLNKKIIAGTNVSEEEISNMVTTIARQKFIQGAIEFSKNDVEKASVEVIDYYNNINKLGIPIESELKIVLSNKDYMIEGNVDMIYQNEDGLNIIDFKTGTPPDENGKHQSIEDYRKQLNLYCYLFQKIKNVEIKSIALYFTDINAKKHLYKYSYNEIENNETIQLIEKTINCIENKDFPLIRDNIDNSLLKFYFDKIIN